MIWKNLLLAGYTAFLAFLLIHVPCFAKRTHNCQNPPSCGNFTNITYPFQLKGDPSGCGDPNYELVCENNRTLILNLYSGKYHLKAIDYSNSTIQIADAGVQDGNCSSLPLYSLADANFSSEDPYRLFYGYIDRVMFISCKTPHKSPVYVDAAPCINTSSSSSNAIEKYKYVVLGDSASYVADYCDVDLVIPTYLPANNTNLTYADVHRALVGGFELWWTPIYCKECSGQGSCQFNYTTSVVECSDPCSFKHVSSFGCFMKLVVQIIESFIWFLGYPFIWGYRFNILELIIGGRFLIGVVCLSIFLIYKWRRRHLSMYDSIEEFLQNHHNLMPIRYSYSEIKKMTDNFKDKLGEGGYGSVFKGKLRSGYLVAVKVLGKSKATGQEFINEVATIGRIHHVNVVRLVGFCVEGSKRALVYDFMPNRSLEKYIFCREGYTPLSWEKMYEISLGVARGIEYLHQGCEMQILHFDIKPHNILLDENFIPKVSDFGLAKLYPTNHSIVTLTAARGTIGYIAPELFYKNIGGVSYKADVYSFGMLLMEMAGKRKNFDQMAEQSSQVYFPFWVHEQIADGKEIEMEATEEENIIIRKMVMAALWCIQTSPSNRPAMNKVVEMLEGEVESLQLPPRPSLYPEETVGKDVRYSNTNQTWTFATSPGSSESVSLITNSV